MIATGADLATISRQLGHANVNITLTTCTRWFARRTEPGLGAKLEALVEKEIGCVSAASENLANSDARKPLKKLVASGGIEPPTRGFSGPAGADSGEPSDGQPAA